MREIKLAQDLINARPFVMAGFNQFIYGSKPPQFSDYADKSQWYSETQGYEFAEKMAKEEGIAFTHIFKCSSNKASCFPFSYGGVFVCNSCGRSNLKKDWWEVQVEKDGSHFCCHGLDFINLQESDNYAFGETFEEAISNYETLMLTQK
jgi:hypothetical protein